MTWTRQEQFELECLFGAGLSYATLAPLLRRSPNAVAKACHRFGLYRVHRPERSRSHPP